MDIFQKQKLRPSQLRTVADRRLGDAQALYDTGRNAHANGAIYLAGFCVECLLKAELLETHAWLQSSFVPVSGFSKRDSALWNLCYRSHNLEGILESLPAVQQRISELLGRGDNRVPGMLKSVCARWTVFARYSPRTADLDDARDFIERVKVIRSWLN